MPEIIHTRPSPEEMLEAGNRISIIRSNIGVLRGELETLEAAWAPTKAHDQTYRDV